MTFILSILFAFLATMTFFDFKKSKELKGFSKLISGKIVDISTSENGTWFSVEYFEKDAVKKIYLHNFSATLLDQGKILWLSQKFLNKKFYLIAKESNGEIIELKAYSNAKMTRWVYLALLLLVAFFLFKT